MRHVARRMCVGCRGRAPFTDLLRVVLDVSERTEAKAIAHIRADPRNRLPGRGAWIHPNTGCLAVAERRRAFGRALRITIPVDSAALVEYVHTLAGSHDEPAEVKSVR